MFGSFLREEGEGFGGVLTTSNPSFLIPKIGEIWRESRVHKLLIKWITQFTLSILTKLQTNYINKFTLYPYKFALYPSLVSNFSQLSQPWRLCCLSLTWFLPLFTLALSLSHNFFTLNCLSRLGFSFRGKLYFSFCFMGFF